MASLHRHTAPLVLGKIRALAPRWSKPRPLPVPLLVLFALIVLIARRPDAFFNPQFWAEDAVLFHVQAETLGARSLLEPAMGYHHAIPRLVALVTVRLVPAVLQPAAFNYAMIAVVLLVFVSFASSRWPGPRAVFLVGAVLLVPQCGEIFCTLTNVQWVTALFIVFTAAVPPPDTRLGCACESFALLLFGLTGPFSIALLPLHLVRAYRFGRPAWLPGIALALAAALQASALLHAAAIRPTEPEAAHLGWIPILGFRLFMQSLLSGRLAPCDRNISYGVGLAGLLFVSLCATFPGPHRRLRLTLTTAAVLIQAAVIFKMHSVRDLLFESSNGSRYFYNARVLFYWLLLVVVFEPLPRWLRSAAVAALVCGLTASFQNFRLPPLPDLKWSAYAGAVQAHVASDIPVNPVPYIYHYPGRPVRPPPSVPSAPAR